MAKFLPVDPAIRIFAFGKSASPIQIAGTIQ